ncbi:MAG: hypothetical protein DRI36_00835 [Caldiserica bacterium]|nr:MAG: hypothetical protein DRI36_00835 [Caldisericota bacterium]
MNIRQRDNLVKFFYTLSTASFTGMVVVSLVIKPSWILAVIGVCSVIIFAVIAYLLDGMEIFEERRGI